MWNLSHSKLALFLSVSNKSMAMALQPMDLEEMASHLLAMASNLEEMASNLLIGM